MNLPLVRKILLIIVVWILAFFLGTGWGRSWGQGGNDSPKKAVTLPAPGEPAFSFRKEASLERKRKNSFEERRWNKYMKMPLEEIPGEIIYQTGPGNHDPLALYILLSRLAKKAPRTALDSIAFFGEEDASFYRRFVFRRWGERDPENAAACYLERCKDFEIWSVHFYGVYLQIPAICDSRSYFGGDGLRELVEAWCRLDPVKSREWIKAHEWKSSFCSEPYPEVWCGYIRGLASRDPQWAAANLKEFPDNAQEMAGRELAEKWVLQNWASALQWIRFLDDAKMRKEFEDSALYALFRKDPDLAIQAGADEAFATHGHRYYGLESSFLNMEQRGAWVKSLPESQGKLEYVADLMLDWTDIDFNVARTWLESLPKGRERDAGINLACGGDGKLYGMGYYRDRGEVMNARQAAPLLSLAMLSSTSEARMDSVEVPLRKWGRSDTPAALQWLDKSALTKEEKVELQLRLIKESKKD